MTKLLLAEDDRTTQMLARVSLQRAGFDVTIANNGVEALERVAESRPDVIVLDWMMPHLDGPGVCATLKADPSLRDIPVIFLTARPQEATSANDASLGALGYITKPFDVGQLGLRVKAMLGQ
jgi:two-component system phosphate regulon response regulator PhoB